MDDGLDTGLDTLNTTALQSTPWDAPITLNSLLLWSAEPVDEATLFDTVEQHHPAARWALLFVRAARRLCSKLRKRYPNSAPPAEVLIPLPISNTLMLSPLQYLGWRTLEAAFAATGLAVPYLQSQWAGTLYREYWDNHHDYRNILEILLGRALDSDLRNTLIWQAYAQAIEDDLETPLLGEKYCLLDVYQQPRGRYQQHIFELKLRLEQWLHAEHPSHLFQVLLGDAGAGKTAFLKMFALAQLRQNYPVVLIDLNSWTHIGLQPLTVFLQQHFQHSPYLQYLDAVPAQLLVMLDDIDKVPTPYQNYREVIREFYHQLNRLVHLEQQHIRCLATAGYLTSKDINSKWHHAYFLLPYALSAADQDLQGPNPLLQQDQRLNWWRTVNGYHFRQTPQWPSEWSLAQQALSAHPLCNQLLSYLYFQDVRRLARAQDLGSLCEEVIVHEAMLLRKTLIPTPSIDEIIACWEDLALQLWEQHNEVLSDHHVQKILDRYACGQQLLGSGIVQRYAQGVRFYSTALQYHLTARALVRRTLAFHSRYQSYFAEQRHQPIIREWLQEFVLLWGKRDINALLLPFVQQQWQSRCTQCTDWKQLCLYLLEWMISAGLPLDHFRHLSYPQMRQCAIHSKTAVMMLHQLSYQAQKPQPHPTNLAKIEWGNRQALGTWLYGLQGQRSPEGDSGQVLAYLGGLNLQGVSLVAHDLQGANLAGSNLNSAHLDYAQLAHAHCENTSFNHAQLHHAHLQGSSFAGSDLSYAHLNQTNFSHADLSDCQLEHSQLTGSNLSHANLLRSHMVECNLEQANLTHANLSYARLARAQLSGACLYGADLRWTKCEGAHFDGADLRASQLQHANLIGLNFADTQLQSANLAGSKLRGCNFYGAHLQGACLIDNGLACILDHAHWVDGRIIECLDVTSHTLIFTDASTLTLVSHGDLWLVP